MKVRTINYKTKKKNALRDSLDAFEKKIAEHQKKLAEITSSPYYSNINKK
jgi:hypothetical protein